MTGAVATRRQTTCPDCRSDDCDYLDYGIARCPTSGRCNLDIVDPNPSSPLAGPPLAFYDATVTCTTTCQVTPDGDIGRRLANQTDRPAGFRATLTGPSHVAVTVEGTVRVRAAAPPTTITDTAFDDWRAEHGDGWQVTAVTPVA